MSVLLTIKESILNISPFYNIGILIATAFLLVFFAASRKKGVKIFSLAVLVSGICCSLIFDILSLNVAESASNQLFSINTPEYVQIAVLLSVSLLVLFFFSLYNLDLPVFGRTLLFFAGILISLSFLIVSEDFIAMFTSLSITILFLFFIVSGINKYTSGNQYHVLRFFIRPGISLGLIFLGFSFIYGATDFRNFQQIIESDKSGLTFVILGMLLFFGAVFLFLFTPPFQNPYSKLIGKGRLGTENIIFFFYFTSGLIFLQKISFFYIEFLQKSEIALYISLAIALVIVIIGNIISLSTSSLRRVVAFTFYSFIGFFIVALVLKSKGLLPGIGLGLINSYIFAFLVLSYVPLLAVTMELENKYGNEGIVLLNGIVYKNTYMGIAVVLSLLNLAGFIAFPGFIFRYNLFKAVIDLQAGLPGILMIVFLSLSTILVFVGSVRLIVLVFRKDENNIKGKISFYKFLYIFIALIILAELFIGIAGLVTIFGDNPSFIPAKIIGLFIS